MTLQMEEETTVPFLFDYKKVARDVIHEALSFEKFPYEAEIGMTLTDDASIQDINCRFRQIDRATDVLSFPMFSFKAPGDFSAIEDAFGAFYPKTEEVLLGDIVISVEHVTAQAKIYGHSEKREFAFLIAHSMLHLMGYDHMEPGEQAVMEEKQAQILRNLNITREEFV